MEPDARAVARVALAARLAGELCELPTGVWAARSYGARVAQRARVSDDLLLADAMAEVWDVARDRPVLPERVWSRSGPGGTVVVAHGGDWSLVVRVDGPVLVLSDRSEQVARIDGDRGIDFELTGLVPELVAASRGEAPFDPESLPPPPPMPWHRPDRESGSAPGP
jgi:hypothetical protein